MLRNVKTGEELLLTDVKNITYSPEKVYLNKFGDAHHFILYFPHVPTNWNTFDLIELIDGENPFIFKDIKRNATGIYKKEYKKTNKALRIAHSDTNRVGDTTVVIQ